MGNITDAVLVTVIGGLILAAVLALINQVKSRARTTIDGAIQAITLKRVVTIQTITTFASLMIVILLLLDRNLVRVIFSQRVSYEVLSTNREEIKDTDMVLPNLGLLVASVSMRVGLKPPADTNDLDLYLKVDGVLCGTSRAVSTAQSFAVLTAACVEELGAGSHKFSVAWVGDGLDKASPKDFDNHVVGHIEVVALKGY